MFKYLFCFFLVFSISSNFLGQTNKYYLLPDSIDLKQLLPEDKVLLDSSMKVYYSAKKESAKLATLKKLAESLTDEEIWPYYNQKIYEMVRDKKDSISVVHKIGAINNIGFINYNKGNIDEALKWFEQSLVLSREFKLKEDEEIALSNLASIYEKKGNIIKALEYFSLALKISEDINNLISQAILLNNLASIYRNQGEFDKAFEMYFSSLKIRDKLKDESGKAAIYNNLAFTYNKQGKSDLALKYYAESLKIRKKLENKGFLSESYGNIGMVYYFNKDFSLAKMYFDSSYAISTKASSKRALLYSLLHYAQYNYSIDNTEEALKNAKQAYDLAQELGFTDEIKSCSEILYKIYKRNGNAGEALKMYEVFVLMKDSLSNLENSKAANKQQFKYEYQKKKEQDSLVYVKERDLAATKLKQERTTKIALYSIIGVILVFSFFLYNRFRLIKKQKHIIELKEKETTHQNEIIIEQKIAVEEKQKEILDSIHYARRIQKALLAHQEYIDKFLPNNFILFQPKDIVSGDFYWAAEHNDKFYLAICDSTGHGVPGAFMSILSIGFLSEAIKEKNIAEPNNILNYVRKRLIESISSDGQKDGFDGVLICFDKGEISYSAANNAPVMVLDGNYRVLPKDKMPVGTGERNSDFELFKIEASVGSMLYVYTDGYADQFGGVGGKKFMYKRLNDLLAKCSNQDLLSQKQIMEDTINKWRGSLEQVDDICLVGIRL